MGDLLRPEWRNDQGEGMKTQSEVEFAHRHCISVPWMRISLNDSPGYTVCNSDGTPNPHGTHFKRTMGELEEIKGQCSFEFVEKNGKQIPNPDWNGECPALSIKKVEPLILEPPAPAPNAVDIEARKERVKTFAEQLEEILAG